MKWTERMIHQEMEFVVKGEQIGHVEVRGEVSILMDAIRACLYIRETKPKEREKEMTSKR